MSAEVKKEVRSEIAHVLFIDIVGYSKLLIDEQHAQIDKLNGIVRATQEFQTADSAGRLIKIPTGDGLALVFYSSPEDPVECAIEISRALKEHPELRLRMGVNSGPVNSTTDVNERANVAGVGINMAQRVMDCGDAGHILLSQRVADDLGQYRSLATALARTRRMRGQTWCSRIRCKFLHERTGKPGSSGKVQERGWQDYKAVPIFCFDSGNDRRSDPGPSRYRYGDFPFETIAEIGRYFLRFSDAISIDSGKEHRGFAL